MLSRSQASKYAQILRQSKQTADISQLAYKEMHIDQLLNNKSKDDDSKQTARKSNSKKRSPGKLLLDSESEDEGEEDVKAETAID